MTRVRLVIAHRGASGTRPENTLAAFQRAHELGAHMIELDVQLTRDGEVVVMHDWTLRRTARVRGRVGARTLAELRQLEVGSWFAPGYASERVPTLGEVLACVPLPVNVELKARRGDDLETRALEVVEAAGAAGRVVFSSFDAGSLVRLRRRSESAAIAVLWSYRRLTPALRLAARVRATALHLRKEATAPAGVGAAVAEGLQVRVWTVNDPGDSARLGDMGVEGVFTDFPERFLHIAPP